MVTPPGESGRPTRQDGPGSSPRCYCLAQVINCPGIEPSTLQTRGPDRTFPRLYVIARQTFRPVTGLSLPSGHRHCPQRRERPQVRSTARDLTENPTFRDVSCPELRERDVNLTTNRRIGLLVGQVLGSSIIAFFAYRYFSYACFLVIWKGLSLAGVYRGEV